MSKRLGINISWLALMKITSNILPLVTLPYLTKILGVELFGVLAIGMAIQQVAFSFSDYGFGVLGPKLAAENASNTKSLGKLLSAIIVIKLVIFVLVFALIYLLFNFLKISHDHQQLWLLMLVPALLQCLLPIWLFLGVERMANITLVNIFERIVYTLAIFTVIEVKHDLYVIPLIMLFSMSLALIASSILVFRLQVKLQPISLTFTLDLLSSGWGYFYSRIILLLFSKFNVIIVGSVLGEAAAGVFSIAERIYNAARSMVAPLTDALYPHMVKTQNWQLAFKIIKYAVLFSLFTVLLSLYFSDWFFGIFGDDFVASAEIFKILMVAFAFSLISMLIGYPVLGAMGKATFVNRSVLVGASVHFVFIAILWKMEILSGSLLALSLVLTEIVIFSYRSFYLYRSEAMKTYLESSMNNKDFQ